jgi:hypothetical protein
MREFCTYGSVRGAFSNERPYRERINNEGPLNKLEPPCKTGLFEGLQHDCPIDLYALLGGDAGMRLQAGLLHHVFGVGGIAGQPAGKRKRIAEMGQHHLAEAVGRGLVANTVPSSGTPGRNSGRPHGATVILPCMCG